MNNDDKLIDFCAYTLLNEGVSLNAESFFKRLGDALGRELSVTITDCVPQITLTADEEKRLQRAYRIAQQNTFERRHENERCRDYGEYLKKLNYLQ